MGITKNMLSVFLLAIMLKTIQFEFFESVNIIRIKSKLLRHVNGLKAFFEEIRVH